MSNGLQNRVNRLAALAAAHRARLSLLEVAVRCLFTTHPNPERLRAVFEVAGTRFLDHALALRLDDEALAALQDLYQALLKSADQAPRGPPADGP